MYVLAESTLIKSLTLQQSWSPSLMKYVHDLHQVGLAQLATVSKSFICFSVNFLWKRSYELLFASSCWLI